MNRYDDIAGPYSTGPVGTGVRSPIHERAASRAGNGSSRTWTRTIAGQTYAFTIVTMPDGEIRWSVTKYNGYIDARFGCAWSGPRGWVFRPTNDPERTRETTMTGTFPAQLATARKALATAESSVKPLPADLAAALAERYPARYAEALRQVAEIEATIPALRAAYDALADRACHRCNGTGEYGGPTNAHRRGVPYCFYCNGTGERRRRA